MAVVVVDGTNLEQVMNDAGVEAKPLEVKKSDDKPKTDEADKVDPKADAAKPDAEAEDADDEEGEDGLSTRQKRELSAKMLKAIGKKHRQVKEAEEFAADQIRIRREAEARANELDQRIKELTAQLNPIKEDAEPQREDFANDSEFMKASIAWGVKQGMRQQQAELSERQRQAGMQAQFKRAAELVPDFEETVSAKLTYSAPMVAYLQESEMFAELGYHFGKHPKALEKLVSLSPAKQLVELGKIEATLKPFGSSESSSKADVKSDNGSGDKPKPSAQDTGFSPSKARSDAPVIKPLSQSDGSQVEPDVREMDTRQMIQEFQKTNKVNLHARKRH